MIITEQERAALMAEVMRHGNERQYYGWASARGDVATTKRAMREADEAMTAIRALITPDDAGLRTEIAAVIATQIIHPNAVYMNGPFRNRSEQDRCEWAADGIIAVLRGEDTR